MIIQQAEKRKSYFKYLFIPIIAFLGILFFQLWDKEKIKYKEFSPQIIFESITCGAENTSGISFVSNDLEFLNGTTQSKEEAFDGSFSSLTNSKSKYSIGKSFSEFHIGQLFKAEIWVKSEMVVDCYLVAQGNKDSDFYISSNNAVQLKKGWEKLELTFEIPRNKKLTELKIYGFFSGKRGIAYFDELKISYSKEPNVGDHQDTLRRAALYLDNAALSSLSEKRDEAIQLGILKSSDDDWVMGKWSAENEDQTEVSLRLKGDWTDHLRGKDWSYRIKFPSDQTWARKRTFSIQHPKTRYYLSEWLFHEALSAVDVITPRYDFFWFSQNDDPVKLYAYEEHFEKQIAEFRDRREGVIIRFSEDGFWDSRLRDKQYGSKLGHTYSYNNAAIYPFKENKTISSSNLKEQLEYAQNLLYGYQYGSKEIDEVFDVDRLAKYYAICDIFEAQHSLIWHNQRFYFNPITRLLEPIGFDGFTETGAYKFRNTPFFGAYASNIGINSLVDIYQRLFSNPKFAKKYYQYLSEYSSPQWIDAFYEQRKDQIGFRKNILETQYPNYTFKKDEFLSIPKKIHSLLQPLEQFDIRVFEGDSTWSVCNFYCLPIEIIGSCTNEKSIKYFEEPHVITSTWRDNAPKFDHILREKNSKYLVWRVLGEENINRFVEIKNWNYPVIVDSKKYFKEMLIPISKENYSVKKDEIIIKPGSYSISSPLVIPEGTRLIIASGTSFDLKNHAFILAYGSVEMLGTKEKPILISSSSEDSQGFHVIAGDKPSIVYNTKFDNLNTISDITWKLTGAVTFYETTIEMKNVTISNNHCEDALNIIRSNVDISYLNINNTFADGFDCDFCQGYVKHSSLHNTGNDGLDFSGSKLTLDNITLKNIGDKGISAGEQSTLKVFSADIQGAEIGIASKDLSKVDINYVMLKDCNKGFAAYQKKPEFGPAEIKVKKLIEKGVKNLTLKEDGSQIIFEE